MSFMKVLTTITVALQFSALQVIAQSCETICSNYDQTLVNCRDLYSSGVDGSGPINTGAIDCMCVGTESFTGFYEMSECYKCHILTGNLFNVNFAWVITCATNQQSGEQAAVQCWNQELLQGKTGEPCFQGTSQPSVSGSATASSIASVVISSTTLGFGSGATSPASTVVGLSISFSDAAANISSRLAQ